MTIIYIALVLFLMIFFFYPFIQGDHLLSEKKQYFNKPDKVNEKWIEKIEVAKAALKDVQLEKQIGKLSENEYEMIKQELLNEWKEAEGNIK